MSSSESFDAVVVVVELGAGSAHGPNAAKMPHRHRRLFQRREISSPAEKNRIDASEDFGKNLC